MKNFWDNCIRGFGYATGIAVLGIILYILHLVLSLDLLHISSHDNIDYDDVIIISLTSASVLLTAVAVGIAVLALVGWNRLENIAADLFKKSLETGGDANVLIKKGIDDVMKHQDLDVPRMKRR